MLPAAGGLFDQSPAVVALLGEAVGASAERQEMERKKAKAKNPGR